MAATESRLVALVGEHLDLGCAPDVDRGFADSGISRPNAAASIKVVSKEFDVAVPLKGCDKIGTLGR